MTKIKRKIIKIDEERCDGCGSCLPGCPEGALQIIEGKARLVRESYCDGLGACLGHCPQGALQVEERESEGYDAKSVLAHLEAQSPDLAERHRDHMRAHGLDPGPVQSEAAAGCPSEMSQFWGTGTATPSESLSALGHWPVKLNLISPSADFLRNARLVIMADCVPLAYANIHSHFLKGRAVAIGCPKFDDVEAYREKIQQILESVNIRSITVVYMEITCCGGMVRMVKDALERSGNDVPLEIIQIGVKGEILKN